MRDITRDAKRPRKNKGLLEDSRLLGRTRRQGGVLQAAVGDAVHLQWAAEQAHVFDRASGARVG